MIDPRNIPRPAMFPMTNPCRLTSRSGGCSAPVHSHRAYPDAAGNGMTDIIASHFHVIRNGIVLGSNIDGHIHRLTNVLCGTGI
jgi:hypothetical protein